MLKTNCSNPSLSLFLFVMKGSPIKAGVNGKNVFGPVFSSGRSGAVLSLGFKDLDPSLSFHRSISDASPETEVKIAMRLRRESIMTFKWIAQRLQMGSWTNVSNCLANKLK
jgi:hypothetical protein